MGLRFRKRIKIAKGLNINLSKSGIGFSAGIPGLRVGLGPKGAYSSAGIPGTGLSMMSYFNKSSFRRNSGSFTAQAEISDGFSIKPPTDVKSHGKLGLLFILICIICLFIKWWMFFIAIFILSIVTSMISRSERAKKLCKEAKKLISAEKWSELVIVVNNIKSLYPESKEIDVYLGMSHLFAGNTQTGTSVLEKFLETALPEKGNVRVFLANAYYENKQFDMALLHFDKLSSEYKSLLCIQNMIADSYLQMGKSSLALAVLENGPTNSKENDPDHIEFRYLLAKVYIETGDIDKAKKQASKVYVMDNSYKDIAKIAADLNIL